MKARQSFPLPLTRDLVLIGGGHAHALVLRKWGMDPMPGVRLTVINPGPTAPYTGMLPGFVAGHYARDDLEIDLVRLARFAGARVILGRAIALDRDAQEVTIDDAFLGQRTIGYDIASLDIGIHSDMPDLPGFPDYGLAAKPLGRFASGWARHLAKLRADPSLAEGGLAVIGGGVAGVELSMAMAHGAAQAAGRHVKVSVIDQNSALGGLGAGAERALRAHLEDHGITLIEGTDAERITDTAILLKDGRQIPARLVTGAAGARPHAWLAEIGLDLENGFVKVNDTLRATSDDRIFAAGDCAHMGFAPRPKAGVFAVRQAPILNANFRAALGNGVWKRYRPQRDYLKLISVGGKAAVADKAGLRLEGPWLWRLKDRIDRKFMAQLEDLPAMPVPALPRQVAGGLREMVSGQAPCGGCGAKVAQDALTRALAADGIGPGDDAAVLRMGETTQVITTDQLRPLTEDPALMTRIALAHAMGDCLAMGARPQAALMQLTLPRLAPPLEARMLGEILASAHTHLSHIGVDLVGGHSATGPELAIGFTITGLVDGDEIALGGAQPGDALVLTKPIGSGTIMAAEMALKARGPVVIAALEQMIRTQSDATEALSGARAMTDVTGFGLAGHLMNMLHASQLGATLTLDAIPFLDGAVELATTGTRSTLHAANRTVAADMTLPDDPRAELLFDPQTAGGLLAALPSASADSVVAMLAKSGGQAAIIGRLTDGPVHIEVR